MKHTITWSSSKQIEVIQQEEYYGYQGGAYESTALQLNHMPCCQVNSRSLFCHTAAPLRPWVRFLCIWQQEEWLPEIA